MLSVTGYIPEKVTYVSSNTKEIDIYDSDDYRAKIIDTKTVTPSYPVEHGKSLEAAIKWTGLKSPEIETFDNAPISGVQICDLVFRGNGGRAYKALLHGKYYVDLREDVLMDTIISCGIEKSGILLGKYVWAKLGTQMRLIREGSYIHSVLSTLKPASETKFIPDAKIKAGHIYKTRKSEFYVYFGKFQYFEYDDVRVNYLSFIRRSAAKTSGYLYFLLEQNQGKLVIPSAEGILENYSNSYRFKIQKTPMKFIECLDSTMNIEGIDVPEMLRDLTFKADMKWRSSLDRYWKDKTDWSKFTLGYDEPYLHPELKILTELDHNNENRIVILNDVSERYVPEVMKFRLENGRDLTVFHRQLKPSETPKDYSLYPSDGYIRSTDPDRSHMMYVYDFISVRFVINGEVRATNLVLKEHKTNPVDLPIEIIDRDTLILLEKEIKKTNPHIGLKILEKR